MSASSVSSASFNKFLGIMVFYIFLSYVLGPIMMFYLLDRTLMAAGHGFAMGSLLSIILWYTAGSKMI